ncbi:MAG: toprim domain-containing protein, partial [Muribaculaceae bacterium]|nr:toprim domain-containing protein [Muribaculaceae bacterium]
YKKSNELYGIFQAKGEIARQDNCYLVEGYMDVIGMWQSGMENVVASSGTALTDGQIAMIHRFTDNITLIYDGDAAGIKASLRGIDMLLAHKMNVKVLLLPDGHDPDSFARRNTPEDFRKYVQDHATDIIRFKAQVLLKDVGSDPQKRVEAINSVVTSLAHIPDKVKRNVYVQECSRILGVSEEVIEGAVEKSRGDVVERQRRQRQVDEIDRLDSNETDPQPDVSKKLRPSGSDSIIGMYPYYPMERTVIFQCVRYGLLDFCEVEFEDGSSGMISVVEYIAEELQSDDIWFAFPAFAKTFNRIIDLKEDYVNEKSVFDQNLAAEKKEMLQKGYEEIASQNMHMVEIRRAERVLEENVEEEMAKRRYDFARYYIEQKLSSNHDDDVRRTVMDAINEEQPLSNIYMRNNPVSERKMEVDRMRVLVPRGVLEWKNEMLNQLIRSKMNQLDSIRGYSNPEEEQKILMETQALMEKRGQLGKVMGDRTIGRKIK